MNSAASTRALPSIRKSWSRLKARCAWRDERQQIHSEIHGCMSAENELQSSATGESSTTPAAAPDSGDLNFSEDFVLAQLSNRDLSAEQIEELSKNAGILKSRKVRFALAAHPHSPRHLALRLIRELYTFDLMQLSLMPAVAADLKRLADELLVSRVASITLGERLSLARRCSGFVATALLRDKELAVWQAALQNPRLTEAAIVKALQATGSSPTFVEAICHDPKWSVRHEIRVALLRNPHTPLARALEFARHLPPPLLRDVLHTSRLPEKTKAYLRTAVLGSRN